MVLPVIKQTEYIDILSEILNFEGHLNRCIGSIVTAILLNGWIFPTGGVALGTMMSETIFCRTQEGPSYTWLLNFCLGRPTDAHSSPEIKFWSLHIH